MIIRYDPGGGWHNGELGFLIIIAKLSYRSSCLVWRIALHMYCSVSLYACTFGGTWFIHEFLHPGGVDLTDINGRFICPQFKVKKWGARHYLGARHMSAVVAATARVA